MDILILELGIGIIVVLFFHYKNPQKDLLNYVSINVLLLFLCRALFNIVTWAHFIWMIGAAGLLVTYYLRFKKKETVTWFDYTKWLGVTLLIVNPLTIVLIQEYYLINYLISLLTIPILAVIYIYDRLIIKPGKMKKRFITILSIQTVLILLLLIYSFVQKSEASIQRMMAEKESMRTQKIIKELLKATKQNNCP